MFAERGEHLDEAVDLIQRALKIDPGNGSFLDSLGWAYFKQRKYDLAHPPLAQAAEQLPANSVVQDHLGDTLDALGRRAEAVTAWQRALAGDRDVDRRRGGEAQDRRRARIRAMTLRRGGAVLHAVRARRPSALNLTACGPPPPLELPTGAGQPVARRLVDRRRGVPALRRRAHAHRGDRRLGPGRPAEAARAADRGFRRAGVASGSRRSRRSGRPASSSWPMPARPPSCCRATPGC